MSAYFRMVSSSPPPLDDAPSFDDDDEFGSFASVEVLADSGVVDDSITCAQPHVSSDMPSAGHAPPSDTYATTEPANGHIGVAISADDEQHFSDDDQLDAALEAALDAVLEDHRPPTDEAAVASDLRWNGDSNVSDGESVEYRLDECNDEAGEGTGQSPVVLIPTVTSPDAMDLSFRTVAVASQDSVSDSGLCSASQFSDITCVDTSPDDGGSSGRSDNSPVTVECHDDDGAFRLTSAPSDATLDDSWTTPDEERGTPGDRIRGTPEDRDIVGTERELADGGGEDDDDFADFAGFEPESSPSKEPVYLTPTVNDDDMDEFQDADFVEADFGSRLTDRVASPCLSLQDSHFGTDFAFAPPSVPDRVMTDVPPRASENFASFEEFRFQVPEESQPFRAEFTSSHDDEDEDDEFGNFDSAKPDNLVESDRIVSAVGDTLALTFPTVTEVGEERLAASFPRLDDALGAVLSVEDGDQSGGSSSIVDRGVWSHLYDIDSTHALTYRWGQSQSSQKLLQSLHIDSRNLLVGTKWNSSIPLFAATMSLNPLEPTKAVPKSWDQETLATAAASGAGTTGAKLSGVASSTVDTTNGNCIQENVIPPAQFDWSSSGLLNPLDDSASTLLDLDFFLTSLTNDVITRNTSSKFTKLESELLGDDSGPTGRQVQAGGIQQQHQQQQASPLMEQILRQAATSSASVTYQKTRRRSANLSREARAILDSLPDLNFMQAKVLMFPIRSTAVP